MFYLKVSFLSGVVTFKSCLPLLPVKKLNVPFYRDVAYTVTNGQVVVLALAHHATNSSM